MEVVRAIRGLAPNLRTLRASGAPLGLVPTMGGVHAGHLSLVEASLVRGDIPVVSLFVNPAQFGSNEDLSDYPQQQEADFALLRKAGTALVFAPSAGEIYPPGFASRVIVDQFQDILCAQNRPGHFEGVTLVVAKLLNLFRADRAYFGEKDWQQLQVVRALVRDLNILTQIIGCPVIRDQDGLAMSTRNTYLCAANRKRAPRLHTELIYAAERIAEGDPTELACAEAQESLTLSGFDKVDYLECRHGDTLRLAPSPGLGARVFASAWLGKTRLIDNVPVPQS